MIIKSYPYGSWSTKGKPGRLHIFTDETRQKTLCGFTRGTRPIAHVDSGFCKVCDQLFDKK